MKKLLVGRQIGKELRDVLGLPKNTISFTLRAYPNEVVTVTCEYAPDDPSIGRLLGRFDLVPRDPVQDATQPLHYDTWLRERNERAHAEFMKRTSRRLLCDLSTEDIEAYIGGAMG